MALSQYAQSILAQIPKAIKDGNLPSLLRLQLQLLRLHLRLQLFNLLLMRYDEVKQPIRDPKEVFPSVRQFRVISIP